MITRYVTSDDGTRIAVRLRGDASLPVLLTISPWATVATPVDLLVADPNEPYEARRFWISFDRRGTGASQREVADVGFAAQLQDVEAILRAQSVDSCDLTAYFEGAPIAIAFAARHPERVRRIVLWQPFAEGRDFLPTARIDSLLSIARTDWALAARTLANLWLPHGPTEMQRAMARSFRERISPEAFVRYLENCAAVDVRDDAKRVTAETLVLHPSGAGMPAGPPQEVAALIPNATLQDVDQASSFVATTDVAGRMIDFLDGATSLPSLHRTAASSTAVILFTDIVDSTAMTERIGDAAFRSKSRNLDASLRTIIRDAGGAVIDAKTLGDGVLATFPAAAQAIEAALRFEAAADASGLQLHVGVHAGDVIREDGNVFGGAVNIAARICGLSAPGEILVSDVVRGMARSSAGVVFEDRGEHEMKGVGEAVRVYVVRAAE